MRNSILLAVAYLLHLVVPALLLLDIVTAALQGEIPRTPVSAQGALAAFAALWLLGGLAFFLFSRDRQAFVRRVAAPLLSIYAFYLVFALGEGGVRMAGLQAPIPFMQMGVTRAVSKRDPATYPGISGTKHFSINSLGLRGPLPPRRGSAYRIVTIGGSTTICADLDDSETWPNLLMNYMNASQHAVPVWVGNAGGTGMDTVNHMVLMQWLPGVVHPDLAIFLVGVNDLAATMAFRGGPTEAALEEEAQFQGNLPPGTHWRSKYPRYRRLVLLSLAQQAVHDLQQRIHPPTVLQQINVPKLRERRAASPVLPLPDLTTGLKEYRTRILTLANDCRDLKMRCLFLTQTTMWRKDLSPEEQRLLWLGYVGPFANPVGYASPGDMAQAMDRYNQVLLDVCAQSGLECFDVASNIPKNTSAYFDDMHFNENGARLMAQNLRQYLLSKPPFQGGEKSSSGGVPTRPGD